MEKKEAMFRANLQRTGVYDTRGVHQFNELKWRFETGLLEIDDYYTPNKWTSSPAIADGVVYFGSERGYLYAVR